MSACLIGYANSIQQHRHHCDETPHRAHRTTSRREWRVTGRFTPSSVRRIGHIRRFLLIQLKPSMYFGAVHSVRGAVLRDTPPTQPTIT